MAHTLLLIDDDECVLDVFQRILGKRSYLVDRAQTMTEVRERLAEKNYDAVVADLNLGHADDEGLEVLEFLKDREQRPAIVIWSGYNTASVEEKVLAMGADLFLPKPVICKTLLEKLEGLLHPGCTSPLTDGAGVYVSPSEMD